MSKAIKIVLVLYFLVLFMLEVLAIKQPTSSITLLFSCIKSMTFWVIAMKLSSDVDKEISKE